MLCDKRPVTEWRPKPRDLFLYASGTINKHRNNKKIEVFKDLSGINHILNLPFQTHGSSKSKTHGVPPPELLVKLQFGTVNPRVFLSPFPRAKRATLLPDLHILQLELRFLRSKEVAPKNTFFGLHTSLFSSTKMLKWLLKHMFTKDFWSLRRSPEDWTLNAIGCRGLWQFVCICLLYFDGLIISRFRGCCRSVIYIIISS